MAEDLLDTPIEYLKGIGPKRAEVLKSELGISRFSDLLHYYPFRYIDRTEMHAIRDVMADQPYIQTTGTIISIDTVAGKGHKNRLTATFSDGTGSIELVWFKGAKWIRSSLVPGKKYLLYGKVNFFNGRINIAHPELEPLEKAEQLQGLQPVYHTTEKASAAGFTSKGINKAIRTFFDTYHGTFAETLPHYIPQRFNLASRDEALKRIHFPSNKAEMMQARSRLIFEELFYVQLRLLRTHLKRKEMMQGFVFEKIDRQFDAFYKNYLPFPLTSAQKKVIREIRHDVLSGKQMNRLLQGDVGSGKTIVALMTALMAVDNDFQATLLAPTEILATQHYNNLKELLADLPVEISLLTGSTKTAERKRIHAMLEDGSLHILAGTHAILEEKVQFRNLGIAIIDEQHRFGVEQRASLWKKNPRMHPHILVMTATPIPRTLAMTLYGDLDISVIDELPPGRKPITTLHKYDSSRTEVFGLIRRELQKGRQAYIVYPLIEESETQDYKDLYDGYESVARSFPEFHVSIVHGKMKAEAKDFEMQRFVRGETQIMVATTVIEVGVNVPNASVMVIESAEKFGLSQLHQLRGRVGRGAEQSYCILMSSYKLTESGKKRLETMVQTNDGFRIAEVDLELRGPGDIEGKRQSGELRFRIADITRDQQTLVAARNIAKEILEKDPALSLPENQLLRLGIVKSGATKTQWSKIS